MTNQTASLIKEWNGRAGDMLNSEYVLRSDRATLIEEKFDGLTYSRIHRCVSGKLIVEERSKGAMYARTWELIQDFSELEAEFQRRT